MIIPAQRIRIHDSGETAGRLYELMHNGQLSYGKHVRTFERKWAEVCEAKHAVATNSCTSALEIAIRALRIPKNKAIAMPANTYGATPQAAWNAGHNNIELVDILPDLCMDIDRLPWYADLGAVVFVPIGGNVPERLKTLSDRCNEAGIPLIIDAAHAHGVPEATSYGDVQCFSFYSTKLITTFGEGGALVTNNQKVADYARRYRHHGRVSEGMDWDHVQRGANMCMTEAQAVVGIGQVEQLDKILQTRQRIAKIYNEKFTPVFENGNYYKYIIHGRPYVKNRDITLPSPVYPKPLHKHTFWPDTTLSLPMSEKYCPGHFCLPIYNDMIEAEAEFVLHNVEVAD